MLLKIRRPVESQKNLSAVAVAVAVAVDVAVVDIVEDPQKNPDPQKTKPPLEQQKELPNLDP